MKTPAFCKNNDPDQLCVIWAHDQRLCFCYTDFYHYFLNYTVICITEYTAEVMSLTIIFLGRLKLHMNEYSSVMLWAMRHSVLT